MYNLFKKYPAQPVNGRKYIAIGLMGLKLVLKGVIALLQFYKKLNKKNSLIWRHIFMYNT